MLAPKWLRDDAAHGGEVYPFAVVRVYRCRHCGKSLHTIERPALDGLLRAVKAREKGPGASSTPGQVRGSEEGEESGQADSQAEDENAGADHEGDD